MCSWGIKSLHMACLFRGTYDDHVMADGYLRWRRPFRSARPPWIRCTDSRWTWARRPCGWGTRRARKNCSVCATTTAWGSPATRTRKWAAEGFLGVGAWTRRPGVPPEIPWGSGTETVSIRMGDQIASWPCCRSRLPTFFELQVYLCKSYLSSLISHPNHICLFFFCFSLSAKRFLIYITCFPNNFHSLFPPRFPSTVISFIFMTISSLVLLSTRVQMQSQSYSSRFFRRDPVTYKLSFIHSFLIPSNLAANKLQTVDTYLVST